MNTKSILLLGSIALDTIKTKYGVRKELLGGSATYAAISSSPFVKVNLVGIIGDDFPKVGEKILKESCNSITDLVVEKGETFRWGGEYHENGDDRAGSASSASIRGDAPGGPPESRARAPASRTTWRTPTSRKFPHTKTSLYLLV